MTLSKEDRELIESLNQEFLINFKAKDRHNAYTKYIKRITMKYLGIALSQTDIRHVTATNDCVEQCIDQDFIDKFKMLSYLASQRGHSLSTALKKYVHM